MYLINQQPPKFSDGWLANWKRRYRVKKYVYHEEDDSVEINAEGMKMLADIQQNYQFLTSKQPAHASHTTSEAS